MAQGQTRKKRFNKAVPEKKRRKKGIFGQGHREHVANPNRRVGAKATKPENKFRALP